jgi:micrococcal nuclease
VHTPSRRRFRRQPLRLIVIVLSMIVVLLVRYFNGPPSVDPRQDVDAGPRTVERVVDGDTLIVEGNVRVRLIGVNAPESVKPEHPVEPWGPEAAEFTRKFLASGPVRLSFDRERVDQYGRQLAYVWVGQRLLNEELLREGLARWEPNYHYQEPMKRRLRQAQKDAKAAHRGIWSEEPRSQRLPAKTPIALGITPPISQSAILAF